MFNASLTVLTKEDGGFVSIACSGLTVRHLVNKMASRLVKNELGMKLKWLSIQSSTMMTQ